MLAVLQKELKRAFAGRLIYWLLAVLLFFEGLFVSIISLLGSSADLSLTPAAMQTVLILWIPLLSLRGLADENRQCTDRLLFALPLRTRDIVLGKFAAQTLLFVPGSLPLILSPLLLSAYGSVNVAQAYLAIFGYLLMGLSLIATCALFDALVSRPLWGILASVALLLFYTAAPTLALFLPTALHATPIPDALTLFNPIARFSAFTYGYLDLAALFFYLTYIGVLLFLSVQAADARRRA